MVGDRRLTEGPGQRHQAWQVTAAAKRSCGGRAEILPNTKASGLAFQGGDPRFDCGRAGRQRQGPR